MNARRIVALGLAAASGYAGLGYQIVWTQQGALWMGHEAAAMLAVVAAFFGGLALGALLLGPRIERSIRPVRWYALLEASIGAWALVLLWAFGPVGDHVVALTGPQPAAVWQWVVAFATTFVLLLPATAAMGATLPALARTTAGLQAQGRAIAGFYAANTLGATCGVLVTAFWLVPAVGLTHTALLCALLNLGCAVLAGVALPRAVAPPPPAVADPARGAILWRLAATGLLGIGHEVLVVRVLGQLTEDTVYTYALLLAVYLLGTALGAAASPRLVRGATDAATATDRLLQGVAAACLLGAGTLWFADGLKAWLVGVLGAGVVPAMAIEAALAVAAFALPTFAMGALFCQLAARAQAAGAGFGRALGVNTLGAAAAPALFGVVLAPLVAPKAALLAIVAGYLALARRRSRARPAGLALGGSLVASALLAPPLAFVDLPEGGRIVSYREGTLAAVSVVEDAEGVATLRINNRQQEGSSATRAFDARQALLPLLLHPAPRSALFLGLGTGTTAAYAAADPTLQVDVVELLPEVIEAARHFARGAGDTSSALHIIKADARRYVRATDRRYDVIVSDNFHPARSGSGALYTVEHFQAVKARLRADGVFCQWLPLHQLDPSSLRSIVRAFLVAYPEATALLASNSLQTPVLGLVGRARAAIRWRPAQVKARLASAAWAERPGEFGVDDEFALLGSFVAGPAELARYAGATPVNTDDRPVVAYGAPRITYAADSLPRDRLLALLQAWSISAPELLAADTDPDWTRRWLAYRAARDRYLVAGSRIVPSADVRTMLAQVQAPLLQVLRTSPDFRPAYGPLLQMATALAVSDRPAAVSLLNELVAIQPAREDALQILATLGSSMTAR